MGKVKQLAPKEGKVIEVPKDYKEYTYINNAIETVCSSYLHNEASGKIVGNHNGAHYYTIGQRKGLNIGGTPEPLFIIDTDTKKNIIYVGQGENHPGLYRNGLFVTANNVHWIREDLTMKVGDVKDFLCRIRYRQELTQATLHKKEKGLYVVFNTPQRGITPGQFIAWYNDDELIGSGVIDR